MLKLVLPSLGKLACGITFVYNGTRTKTVSVVTQMVRIDKMMKKMKKKEERSDKWYLTPLSSQKPSKHHTGKARYSTPGTKRKAEHISNLLFYPISEILCGGVLDVKVEISQVNILADFSLIKIHWLASDRDHIQTEQILEKKTIELQDLIKELQIISSVPPVRFVKDMSVANVEEVERLLQAADFSLLEDREIIDSEGYITDGDGDMTDSDWYITDGDVEIPDCDGETADLSVSVKGIAQDSDQQLSMECNENSYLAETELTKRFRQDLYGVNHEAMIQRLKTLKSGLREKMLSYEEEPEKVKSTLDRKLAREQYAKMLDIRRSKKYALRRERKNKYNDQDGLEDLDEFH